MWLEGHGKKGSAVHFRYIYYNTALAVNNWLENNKCKKMYIGQRVVLGATGGGGA